MAKWMTSNEVTLTYSGDPIAEVFGDVGDVEIEGWRFLRIV